MCKIFRYYHLLYVNIFFFIELQIPMHLELHQAQYPTMLNQPLSPIPIRQNNRRHQFQNLPLHQETQKIQKGIG